MRLIVWMMTWGGGSLKLPGQGRLLGFAVFLGVSAFWAVSLFGGGVAEASAPAAQPALPPAQSPSDSTPTPVPAPKPCEGAPTFDEDGNAIDRDGDESCPTADGLGECAQGMYVEALNRDRGNELHNMTERHTDGGFTVTLILNCRASKITWSVVNDTGRPVAGVGGVIDQTKFDEVDWVYLEAIEYVRHASDGPDSDGDGSPDYEAGEIVIDDNGHAVIDDEAMKNKPRYKAYRTRFDYRNAERKIVVNGEEKTTRPLEADRTYSLRVELEPYSGAPDNHRVSFVADILDKVSGNLITRLLHLLTPTTWIEWGARSVLQGVASGVQISMCTIMPRFMTAQERVAFDHYYDEDDQKWKPVGNHDNQNVPNANGNCKNPPGFEVSEDGEITSDPGDYYDELERLKKDAIARKRGENSAVASAPLVDGLDEQIQASSVIDRTDPRSVEGAPVADFIGYDLGHIPLAPRLVLDRNLLQEESEEIASGIVTFTGLITGTPAELTYERGIVRVGWSMVLNVTVSVFVLIIVWIGLSQIAKGFLGNKNMADWRELIPRLVLAIIAALTSYWWCSLLIDLADGISRYLAAGMRVTPADVTLVLAQSLGSVLVKSLPTKVTGLIPFWGAFALLIKLGTMTISVSLMITFSMLVLMIIGQFVMRIVLLNLLIMLSPLAFAMWALPETSSWGKRWLQTFMTTLWQHGLQIICFAMALWFVRLATPIGIITNTGEGLGDSLTSAVGLDLPTEMIWALALGVMGMITTFKLPGMLGNSVMESWVSTIGMATMGFKNILGFAGGAMGGGGGGAGGGLSALMAPGSGGGFMGMGSGGSGGGMGGGISPSIVGSLPANLMHQGMGVAMGAVTSFARAAQMITGGGSSGGDGGGGLIGGGGSGSSIDDDPPIMPHFSDQEKTDYTNDGVGTEDTGEQRATARTNLAHAKAGVAQVTRKASDAPSAEVSSAGPKVLTQVAPANSPIGDRGGDSSDGDVGPGYKIPTSDNEGAPKSNFNHDGLVGKDGPPTGATTNEEIVGAGLMGKGQLASDLINQTQFKAETKDGVEMLYAKGKDDEDWRVATPGEAKAASIVGIPRLNHMLGKGGIGEEVQKRGAQAMQSEDRTMQAATVSRAQPSKIGAIKSAFREGRQGYLDDKGTRVYQNMDNSREEVGQNRQGNIDMLRHSYENAGEDSVDGLARKTGYVGYGDWRADGDGNLRKLSAEQVAAKAYMQGGDTFADNMRYQTTAEKDSDTGEYKITQWQDGVIVNRIPTAGEKALLDDVGTRGFNSAFRGQGEYKGEGFAVRDQGSAHARMSTKGESDFLDHMGQRENNGEGTPESNRLVAQAMGKAWKTDNESYAGVSTNDSREGSLGRKGEQAAGRWVKNVGGNVGSRIKGKSHKEKEPAGTKP